MEERNEKERVGIKLTKQKKNRGKKK